MENKTNEQIIAETARNLDIMDVIQEYGEQQAGRSRMFMVCILSLKLTYWIGVVRIGNFQQSTMVIFIKLDDFCYYVGYFRICGY